MVRYKPSQFTKKELEIMVAALAADAGLDFLTGGKLNKYKRKAAIAVYRSVVRPVATRAALPAITSVARAGLGASRLVFLNPYVVGGTAIYVGYKERERIKQLLDQGYEIVREEVAPPVSQFMQEQVFTPEAARRAQEDFMIPQPFKSRRPKLSSFNKAVGAGMKAAKKSKSYGGVGKLVPATKVFSIVTKLASAKKKKKKAPKSGIRRTIWNAMKGLR